MQLSGQEPRAPLLTPKLRLPRLRSSLVFRERLLAQLDAGLERKLTLLSAPAGFGKTTLVSQWVSDRSRHHHLQSVAWVALDAGDNDPVRFWRYVITACLALQIDPGSSALAQLLAPQQQLSEQSFLETALATFLNELASLADGGILVLEDYHVITSSQIHEMMIFLIDHLPVTLHLILIARSDPPLPLARWRAHDDLNELRTTDLRFTEKETRTFLEQTMPFSLSCEMVTGLETHTEGWGAGLRLMTLALQGHMSQQEIEHFLMTFTGGHRHILEYLVTEVLSAQSEQLQQFLLQTTILHRLTGPLCDAITDREDGKILLEQLERANLFLVALDESGQWYRYHALFAEAMQHEARHRLGEDMLRLLYSKASDWYEQHGLLDDAVEAALCAQDFERALGLIARVIGPQHFTKQQEYYTLRRWLEQLPDDVLSCVPDFCFMYAVMLFFVPDKPIMAPTNQFEKPLQVAEQAWQAEGNTAKLGEVLALRSLAYREQGNTPQALTCARQALAWLPESDISWRSISLGVIGSEELLAGQLNVARQTLHKAYALSEMTGNPYAMRSVMLMVADIYLGQRELHRAAELYRQALSTVEKDLTDKVRALLGLATLAYEWNELETARCEAQEVLELSEQGLDEIFQTHASLILVQVQHVHKQTSLAQEQLSALLARMQPQKSPLLYRKVLVQQAQLQLAVGDLAAVLRWMASYPAHQDNTLSHPQQEQEGLLVARLRMAQGEFEEARRILNHWQIEVHEAGRTHNELKILVVKSLAFFHDKQIKEAKQILREVLTIAYIENYQRLFLDEGETVAGLLRAVLPDVKEEAIGMYVRILLQAFAQERSEQASSSFAPNSSTSTQIIEPLSQQELRVLRLLVAGRSNPEIARELVVSINTVKAHVKSIYRKLDVNNRVEASDVARHLKLL